MVSCVCKRMEGEDHQQYPNVCALGFTRGHNPLLITQQTDYIIYYETNRYPLEFTPHAPYDRYDWYGSGARNVSSAGCTCRHIPTSWRNFARLWLC